MASTNGKMKIRPYTERQVKVLPVGNGPVRVQIGMGFTREIDGVWIKPNVLVEVPKPGDITLEEYIDMTSEYAIDKLVDCLDDLCEMNGISYD